MNKNTTDIKAILKLFINFFLIITLMSSCIKPKKGDVEIFETSAGGNQLTKLSEFPAVEKRVEISIMPEKKFQEITGFGGSFTEASAHLINRLSKENRNKILEAYFGESGARYSLTRTHMNSCDFALGNYSFAPVEGDIKLDHFSIQEDREDILPMIRDAKAVSREGFKIISSPWTAPPWMKDNKDWRGGKLLPEYYDTWALFFSKYIDAYKAEGIDIWGFTVENEPLGNDNNWESMLFSPEEMTEFVKNHLNPVLKAGGHEVKILGYDQNRDEQLKKWADVMFADEAAKACFDGTAVHWYGSTYDYFPEALQYVAGKAPGKHLINTESCIDAQVPRWKDDTWYWSKEARDWGWDWAPQELKYLHPEYVPVFRYARDIIGCLNNGVDGWIDWNMVLDRQGGPNHAKNWCIAPVIVDTVLDEIYFTPLFYTLAHFSRFIRPGAVRIGVNNPSEVLMVTAAINPDKSIAVVIFNPGEAPQGIRLALNNNPVDFVIGSKAVQTILIKDYQ